MAYGSPTPDKVTATYNVFVQDNAIGVSITISGIVGEGGTVTEAEDLVQKIISTLNDHPDLTVSGTQIYVTVQDITP